MGVSVVCFTVQKPAPKRLFEKFNVQGKVFVITGGGRGLGLMIAEGIAEAGGKVYCLDRLPEPDEEFSVAQARADPDSGGSLHYRRVDVRNREDLDNVIASIASDNGRLDGLVTAAAIQQIKPAIEYTQEEIATMMDINYTGVFMAATSAASQMIKYKTPGSIVLVASMSGFVANKGLISSVYNSSKAAVVQLGRNLAMEWGKMDHEGCRCIRVNSLCPGHIITPMVEENFREVPGLKETWEKENMMGRLSRPEEFKGPALFLLSDASSFMTAGSLVVDGGHTAW
ncbi:oxidoreductase [Xylogone sp. PMI_703]|nr:oxidoreductase [Xylogone sp. PMI_703]